jgi:hypothetical protein
MSSTRFQLIQFALLIGLANSQVLAEEGGVFQTIQEHGNKAFKAPVDLSDNFSGPVIQVKIEGADFFVSVRQDKLLRGNCQNCHQPGLALTEQTAETNLPQRQAHWDFALTHPATDTDCNLCHDRQTGSLQDLKGEKISFDHVYQLCGQCHFQAKNDWQGGAHGKRLGGWAGTPVRENCTGCHNPHEPQFPKKRPSTYVSFPER